VHAVDVGRILDERGGDGTHHPADFRVGQFRAEGRGEGEGEGRVPKSA
jgi:hypothetical protein